MKITKNKFFNRYIFALFINFYPLHHIDAQHESTTVPIHPSYRRDDDGEERGGYFRSDHEYLIHASLPSSYSEESVMDIYGLPGMQQEFKVELLASTFQCFHQNLQKGAKFYVYFEVLKGADKNIDFVVIRPDGFSLKDFQWINEGVIDTNLPLDGIYTICMDNRLSRYSNKIVFLFMNSYFEADWEQLSKDYHAMVTGMANFTESFQKLDHNVKQMLTLKSFSGQQVIKDWYLIVENNRYVQKMSIILCIIIILTSTLQVFFVRKLFSQPKTTKPRA